MRFFLSNLLTSFNILLCKHHYCDFFLLNVKFTIYKYKK